MSRGKNVRDATNAKTACPINSMIPINRSILGVIHTTTIILSYQCILAIFGGGERAPPDTLLWTTEADRYTRDAHILCKIL